MTSEIALFWFRRDLRLDDNAGLYRALRSGLPVLPIFIFDENILTKLEDRSDRRINFIHKVVTTLKSDLESLGSTLLVRNGHPSHILADLASEYRVSAVFTNHDYEPYAKQRDADVAILLAGKGIAFYTHKDQCVFEKDEVLKDDGRPYTVFTPYSRKWKTNLNAFHLKPYPTRQYAAQLKRTRSLPMLSLAQIGFSPSDIHAPNIEVSNDIIKNYHLNRDIPSIAGTSRLSVHLRFGVISIRALAAKAIALNESFLNELIWRDFYMMILWHFPRVVNGAFKPQYDRIQWESNTEHFLAWCEGRTGYPIVDAGMRELNATGFMHNRVRMIVASFLTKHLLLDWRWGEAYFASKLLDFDLSANNGGWQWAAGSGCDAAPYFRVFSPEAQTSKFDPELKYICQWVPEFQELTYPKPIVEHRWARDRALARYKEALIAG
ncbi:MAG: DNA photolyase family protein [Flavobacteriales bacterium]|nr:DNA photolyase family protein [Flavobacteriales bacterium]